MSFLILFQNCLQRLSADYKSRSLQGKSWRSHFSLLSGPSFNPDWVRKISCSSDFSLYEVQLMYDLGHNGLLLHYAHQRETTGIELGPFLKW